MTEGFLEWNNVSYSIRQGFFMKPFRIIKNLDLKVSQGFSLGLVGSNGAGKTTSIKLGAGILKPDSGSVLINGKSVFSTESRECIGFLTENQYIYPHLKLSEWLRMLGTLSGMNTHYLEKRIKKLIEKFELTDKIHCLLSTLSKGQIQRTGFVQALLHKPKILMLDEPMSGLDPLWRSRIQDILLDFKKKGGTLIFSSHIMSDVARLSDKIAIIGSGRIKWQGNMNNLPESKNVYQAVFNSKDTDILKSKFQEYGIEEQPDGSYLIKLDDMGKQKFIQIAGQGLVKMVSFTPIYPDFEEMLR